MLFNKRLLKLILIPSAVLFVAVFLYAWRIEPGLLCIKEIQVADASIKKDCVIAFMADLHVPLSRTIERKVIANLEKIRPDLILIGGDFSSYNAHARLSIAKIKMLSQYGKIIMVRGNTDQCGHRQCMYCFLKYPIDRLNTLPARILINERMELPEFGISVYGLDDPVTNKDDTLLFRLLDKTQFNILLLHSVYKVDDDRKQKFNLICSGHTHGGQIFFLRPLLHFFDTAIDPRFISGRYDIGKTILLVSNGIGESLLSVRLGVPPEMTVIHARRNAK